MEVQDKVDSELSPRSRRGVGRHHLGNDAATCVSLVSVSVCVGPTRTVSARDRSAEFER